MPSRILAGLLLSPFVLLTSGCPAPPAGNNVTGPSVVVEPGVLSIPTGETGEFTVALSAAPGGQVTLNIACIAGGCGFRPENPVLFFDSSDFSIPQTVFLMDIGFQGRGESVFEVTGDNVTAADVTVVRD